MGGNQMATRASANRAAQEIRGGRLANAAQDPAAHACDPAIHLHHVGFSYGASPVLTDVSLTVGTGEACMVVGENGAGKSTLLKLMLGALTPTAGTVKLFGTPVAAFSDWRRIGYVPQRIAGTYERFPATVAEVVKANRYAVHKGFPPRSSGDKEAVENALAQVGVQNLERRLIGELSGGQVQRVFLARALVNDPDLLVLDEPTSGMDAESVETFVALLQGIVASRRRSVLLVTHDTRRLSTLGARVVRIEAGRLYECGATPLASERQAEQTSFANATSANREA